MTTDQSATRMRCEIDEIPAALRRLATPEAQEALAEVAALLRARAPALVLTVARGSSDHAATYLGYAVQLALRLPVASVGPSVVSIYGTAPRVDTAAVLAISQSGGSADIVALARALGESGAATVALTNTPGSPLTEATGAALDIRAGPERAVAATKSFVNSVAAGLWLLALWSGDTALAAALHRAPDALEAQRDGAEWQEAAGMLAEARTAFVIARGPGLGIAQEMALKLIETSGVLASAYSGAEVLHGPSALLTDGFPVLALTTGAEAAMAPACDRIAAQGTRLVRIPPGSATGHPLVDPLLDLPPFYRLVEALSRARGFDPDAPAFLQKETRTV